MNYCFDCSKPKNSRISRILQLLKSIPFATIVIALIVVLEADQVFPMKIGQSGEGVYGSLDMTLSSASMFRVENMEKDVDPNSDDGDRNFDNGLVTSTFKAIGELELRKDIKNGLIGFFGRGFALYDTEMSAGNTNDHDRPEFNNNGPFYNGSLNKNNEFTDKAEGILGEDVDFLDAFVFGEFFSNSAHEMTLKLGVHALSWGESFFMQTGISSTMSPVDAAKAALPGTEIKEIILPVNQMSASVGLIRNLSFSGYYQFDWKRSILPPVGSYFNDTDVVGEGAENLLIDTSALPFPPPPVPLPPLTIDRVGDIKPSESGQWGAALTYFCEALNSTEFSLFYINYHTKTPKVSYINGAGQLDMLPFPTGTPLDALDSAGYAFKYFEDVQLVGFSFNTCLPVLETAIGFEAAYHQDIPITTLNAEGAIPALLFSPPGTVIDTATKEDMITAEVTFFQDFNMPEIADDMQLILEVGLINTPDLNDGEFFHETYQIPGDELSWGYKAAFLTTWYDIGGKVWSKMSGLDLESQISWSHDVEGVSPTATGFVEDRKSIGVMLNFIWQEQLSVILGYNSFFGAGKNNPLRDRDNVTATVKWSY